MGKITKKPGTTLIGRDAKTGSFVVRKGDGKITTWTVKPRAAATMKNAAKRHERVLKRLADR